MIGLVSVLVGAAQAASRVRDIAAAARTAKGLATARIASARDAVERERDKALEEVRDAIETLRREAAEARGAATEAARTGLAAAIQSKAKLERECADAEKELEIFRVDCEEEEALRRACAAGGEDDETPMLPQNAQAGFPHEGLRRFGCYFLCLVAWAERLRGNGFGADRIIRMYEELVEAGHVRDDESTSAFVVNPAECLNHMLGERRFRSASHESRRPKKDAFIERVSNGRWPHFILHWRGEIWDSLAPGADGYVHDSYRAVV